MGVNPVSSRRDFLADTNSVNQLETRLPLGRKTGPMAEVLLLVSVTDSGGAITNSTAKIRVNLRNGGLVAQTAFCARFYEERVAVAPTFEERVHHLNLLGIELTQLAGHFTGVESNVREYLDLKYRVFQDLRSLDLSPLSLLQQNQI